MHHEIFDGTYSLDDLVDVHEALDWKAANEERLREILNRK
jgi:hypothetical protein